LTPVRLLSVFLLTFLGFIVLPAPAQAATVSTFDSSGGCRDKGGIWWQTLVKWGQPYLEASTGTVRVSVDYVGWTTNSRTVPTDSNVRVYNPDGSLAVASPLTEKFDYVGGTRYRVRNPRNPISSPGRSKITIQLGRDGDGYGDCLVTSVQPALGTDPVIGAVGDIACPPSGAVTATTCQQKAVSNSILAAHVTNFLALGDNQYDAGSTTEYRAVYEPSLGRFKAVTRPIPGNHDYYTTGAAGYFGYFGTLAHDPAKGYYSYNVGAWHLIALSSEKDTTATGAQLAWLKADLAAHPNRCTLAYFHRPRFGDERGPWMLPFWTVLADNGVDLVLTGHAHNYQAYGPRDADGNPSTTGTTEVIVGTGGHNTTPTDWNTWDPPLTQNHDTFGWLKLTLHPAAADLRFVPAVGTFTDNRTVVCS
jgi:hypothetical protein